MASTSDPARMLMGVTPADWDGILHWMIFQTLESDMLLLLFATSLQSCQTPCNPIDGSPPSSPVPGILQARTLEWVAISFSNA